MNIFQFSQITKELIENYVYCLVDPRNKEIFYIGKGQGNRVFMHGNEDVDQEKDRRIKEIKDAGLSAEKYIIRHGLKEKEAFELEATLIDLFSSDFWQSRKLLNLMRGHHSFERGLSSVREIEAFYSVEPITKEEIKHNCLIVNINRTYKATQDPYEATRRIWVLDEKKIEKIELVISEYQGVFRAVYKPLKWFKERDEKGKTRFGFEGVDVSEQYPLYINKQNSFKKQGMANPICYVFGK